MKKAAKDFYNGFSKYNREQRIEKLIEIGVINEKDAAHLKSDKTLSFTLAENLVENLIGYFQIPLGVAINFNIDKRDYIIPMAIEETSVIAAASKTAKWIKTNGSIITKTLGYRAIGKRQISQVSSFKKFKAQILNNKKKLITDVNNTVAVKMFERGGGLKDLTVRKITRDDGTDMAIVHIFVETCDAMGANLINRICEFLKPVIENMTDETVNMCILSNLTDTKLSEAKIIINNIDAATATAITEAALFAHLDPYRAATNNKGVLNGMDAVAIATGNDWRAIEAGIHAYAARTGKYRSITSWEYKNNKLIGKLIAPINVGIIGGVTKIHPTASLCLKMMNITSSKQLARVIAAVGLVQNLGALRALTSEGIVKGHMRLHFTNLCLAAGAKNSEISTLKHHLKNEENSKHLSLSSIKEALIIIRQNKENHNDN